MKPHVILLGPSGVGKTHIAKYFKANYDYHAQDTGDVYKAWLALLSAGMLPTDFPPTTMMLGDAAVRDFVERWLPLGIEVYEEMKTSGQVPGRAIVYFIETIRAGFDNQPARHVQMGAEQSGKPVITSAVSQAEYEALRSVLEHVVVARLHCSQQVVRDGENRRPVVCEADFDLQYNRPEQSHEVARELHERIVGTAL